MRIDFLLRQVDKAWDLLDHKASIARVCSCRPDCVSKLRRIRILPQPTNWRDDHGENGLVGEAEIRVYVHVSIYHGIFP
jgi:hypothetical protein